MSLASSGSWTFLENCFIAVCYANKDVLPGDEPNSVGQTYPDSGFLCISVFGRLYTKIIIICISNMKEDNEFSILRNLEANVCLRSENDL